jgi:hypothetical protein
VIAVSLPARGRPPQAAARRAGLEFVEKLLTKLTGTDTTERNAGFGSSFDASRSAHHPVLHALESGRVGLLAELDEPQSCRL